MIMPGFTAEMCLQPTGTLTRFTNIGTDGASDQIVLQACGVDALAFCSVWTQTCWWSGCGFARLFGSGTCTSCMTACLFAANPLMAPLCTACATAGPCVGRPPCFNLCL